MDFNHSKVIGRGVKTRRWESGSRISTYGSSKEQDVRFWFVYFVVGPSSGLLHSQRSPLLLGEQLPFCLDLLEDILGEDDVTVLVIGVAVFL